MKYDLIDYKLINGGDKGLINDDFNCMILLCIMLYVEKKYSSYNPSGPKIYINKGCQIMQANSENMIQLYLKYIYLTSKLYFLPDSIIYFRLKNIPLKSYRG